MKEPKAIALLSYFTIIGWIVAFVLHQENRSFLGGYHLRQSLGLHLVSFGLGLLNAVFLKIPILGVILTFFISILSLGLFILWIFGIVNALNEDEKPVPVFGDFFQKIFSGMG